jgi:hypothetical protein
MVVVSSGVNAFSPGDRVSWISGQGRICQIHGKKATIEAGDRKLQIKLCHLSLLVPRDGFKVGDAVAHKAYPDRYYGSVYGLSGGRVLVELDGNKFSCFSSSLVPFTGEVPTSQIEYGGRVFRVGDRVFAPISVKEDAEFEIVCVSRARHSLFLESQARREGFEIPLNLSAPLRFVSSPEKLPVLEAIAQVEAVAEAPPAISRGKSKASGWLENYVAVRRSGKSGNVGFPRVPGDDRDPLNIAHWYWRYRYEEKNPNAISKTGFITRAVAVSQHKVKRVQEAIKDGKMIVEILELIKG